LIHEWLIAGIKGSKHNKPARVITQSRAEDLADQILTRYILAVGKENTEDIRDFHRLILEYTREIINESFKEAV
jgi:hypothetical protein